MAKKIAIANQKGGVGKTTITTQTGFHLARIDKARVLVVDMDAQGNTSATLLGGKELDPDATITNDLYREDDFEIKPMHLDNGIDLIGTAKNDVVGYEIEAMDLSLAQLPKKHLAKIEDQYDYILLDCPPTLGRKLLSALIATEYVVCPIKLSGYAVDGLSGLFSTLISVRNKANRNLKILGAIVNEYDRSASHNAALAQVREAIPDLVFKNIICHRSPIDTAQMQGVPVWKVRNGQRAAQEISAVVKELKKKLK